MLVSVLTIGALFFVVPVYAFQPYTNYIYSIDNIAQAEPQAYVPDLIITGKGLNISSFSHPEDIYVSEDGKIYIADTGNNRIVILNKDFLLEKIIFEFNNQGEKDSFEKPCGLFITSDAIYIADTLKERVVVLDHEENLIKTYFSPDSSLMKDYSFSPRKVAVDFANRLFVVSESENRGILEFSEDGDFTGFFGSVKTSSGFNLFRSIATQIQRTKMEQIVPVSYSNLNIDADGFLYTTVGMVDVSGSINNEIFVRKLNPSGIDILKRFGNVPIMGDSNYIKINNEPQISQLCDIALRNNGIYSVLSQKSGRIFTYDDNGNLLYIFGALGNSFGQFSNPVAFDVVNGNEYLVLDRNNEQIIKFIPTEYATLLDAASTAFFQRNYGLAEEKYDSLLDYSAKLDLAYIGKGKCLFKQNSYKEAMRYFKLGKDQLSYSKAFYYYRIELMSKHFNVVMSILLILIIISIPSIIWMKRRKKP